MTRRKKKIRKLRGTRTVARGRSKRGRGRGSRMGRGSVKSKGGGYRNFMHIVKYEPWRFHRKGFVSIRGKMASINVCEIKKLSESKDIDVTEYGYGKVTGKGLIEKALNITAFAFSKTAKEKIEKSGGKAIVKGKAEEKVAEEKTETVEKQEIGTGELSEHAEKV